MNGSNTKVAFFTGGTRSQFALAKVKRTLAKMFPDLHKNGNCAFGYRAYDVRRPDEHVQAHDRENLDGLARNEIIPLDALSVAQCYQILRQCPHTRDSAEQLAGLTAHSMVDGGKAERAVGKAAYLANRHRIRSSSSELIESLIPAAILGHQGARDSDTRLHLRIIFMGQGFGSIGSSSLELWPLDIHDLLRHCRLHYETVGIITAPSPSDQDRRRHLNYRTTMESLDAATADPASVRVGTLQGVLSAYRKPLDRAYVIDAQTIEGEHLDNDAQIEAMAACAISQALRADDANGAFADPSVLPGKDKRPFCSWGTWGLVYHRDQARLRLELMVREILMRRLVGGAL